MRFRSEYVNRVDGYKTCYDNILWVLFSFLTKGIPTDVYGFHANDGNSSVLKQFLANENSPNRSGYSFGQWANSFARPEIVKLYSVLASLRLGFYSKLGYQVVYELPSILPNMKAYRMEKEVIFG